MDIHFTGIRNASYIVLKGQRHSFPVKDRILNVQLTDDEFGKDLSEFKKAIRDTGNKFLNPFRDDFVNIDHYSMNRNELPMLYLNGEAIPETDEHLPIFSFIGKLTKKIAAMPEENFINDLGYLKHYADKALLLDQKLSETIGKEIPDCLERVHQPEKIKKGANQINKQLNNMMVEYFA